MTPFLVKQVAFYVSVVLLVYFIASVVGGNARTVELAVKVLVAVGVVLSISGIIEARTGTNVFGSLNRAIPLLEQANVYSVSAATDSRGAEGRAVGTAQHPIEFGAVLVLLIPLALALAASTRQRRWWIAVAVLLPGMMGALSRTAVPMLVAAIVAGMWMRRKEVQRLWPALIPMVIIIHFAVPGALGSLTKSFFPEGGLIADQQTGVGSGRVGEFGLQVLRNELWTNPIVGVGFSTRVTSDEGPELPRNAPILDNQWIGVLLETGILGAAAMMWLFIRLLRRCGSIAKHDYTQRGWFLAGITSSLAAFMVGMLTFDAFASSRSRSSSQSSSVSRPHFLLRLRRTQRQRSARSPVFVLSRVQPEHSAALSSMDPGLESDKRVDIVIVTYNSAEQILACVEPLVTLPYARVIVVDNASTNRGLKLLHELPITTIALDRNEGFAVGCNVGWREATAPNVLFLNPDARIDPTALERLLKTLERHSNVGAVGPKIVDGHGQLAFSQRRFPRLVSTYAQAFFLHHVFRRSASSDELVRREESYEQLHDAEWVSGACLPRATCCPRRDWWIRRGVLHVQRRHRPLQTPLVFRLARHFRSGSRSIPRRGYVCS